MTKSKIFLFISLLVFIAETADAGRRSARRAAWRLVNTELTENSDSINQANQDNTAPTTDNFSNSSAASDSDLTGKLSMIAGVAAIGFAISKIGPCVRPSFSDCAQMAQAFAQASSMFGQAGSAFDTSGAICGDCNWGTNDDVGSLIGGLDDGGTGLLDTLSAAIENGDRDAYLNVANLADAQLQKGLDALEANGLTLNKATGEIFDKNGNKISAGDGGVPKSLSNKLNAALDAVKKSHPSKASSGSGGAGSGGTQIVFEDEPASRGLASDALSNKKKNDDFLAGLSDGSNGGIGVAGDDIFKMMTRRYFKKIKSREFILKK